MGCDVKTADYVVCEKSKAQSLLINVEMSKIVGILTIISMINTTSERLKAKQEKL